MSSQPGTTGRAGTPGDTGGPHDGRAPEGAPRRTFDQAWPLVLPLALLIILGLAGLRGTVAAPKWSGSVRHDGVAVGLALEVILGVLLLLTYRRRSRAMRAATFDSAPVNDVAAKLRGVLIFVLGAGMIAVAVAIIESLHVRVHVAKVPPPVLPPRTRQTVKPIHAPRSYPFHFPLAVSLYALLILLLVTAVLLSIWWARRFARRPSFGGRYGGVIAEDPEDLREAVESGRSALRTVDDARAAIIACYVAMENSLAERGAARAVADTPDELLARATRSGLVRGTAAARLTGLFYEARFSSPPLGRGQRDAAEQALDELAAALAAVSISGEPRDAEAAP
jgi:hypothetical protein